MKHACKTGIRIMRVSWMGSCVGPGMKQSPSFMQGTSVFGMPPSRLPVIIYILHARAGLKWNTFRNIFFLSCTKVRPEKKESSSQEEHHEPPAYISDITRQHAMSQVTVMEDWRRTNGCFLCH